MENRSKDVKKFTIEVTETLQTRIDVYATSEQEALNIITNDYNDGSIVLDSDNYIDHEIKVVNE